MDFGRSADEQAFADEVRAFLRAHPPATFPADGTDAGYGSGAHSRAFLGALGERGWISLSWPREHGGEARPEADRRAPRREGGAGGGHVAPRRARDALPTRAGGSARRRRRAFRPAPRLPPGGRLHHPARIRDAAPEDP